MISVVHKMKGKQHSPGKMGWGCFWGMTDRFWVENTINLHLPFSKGQREECSNTTAWWMNGCCGWLETENGYFQKRLLLKWNVNWVEFAAQHWVAVMYILPLNKYLLGSLPRATTSKRDSPCPDKLEDYQGKYMMTPCAVSASMGSPGPSKTGSCLLLSP